MPPTRLLLHALACLALAGCGKPAPRVVLYCSQDREFAAPVLAEFESRAGLPVTPRYDTEANKSVGLFREILAERGRPRGDVYWNNEILNTIRLQREGLLLPYDSPAAAGYPAWSRARDHTWHAFASRARVLIVNTKLVPEADRPGSLLDLAAPRWKGKLVMARPLFGTTATQAACLFEVLGNIRAREFYRALKQNGVAQAPGNKQVAEWVGEGRTPRGDVAAVGLTDTDDALAEVRAGRPVEILFPDRAGGGEGSRLGTLFIPNTLMIVRGASNPEGARRLLDYLLSAEVEAMLAAGPSGQIPLHPDARADLPPAIASGRTARAMAVDWDRAADLWEEAQAFLAAEFAGP